MSPKDTTTLLPETELRRRAAAPAVLDEDFAALARQQPQPAAESVYNGPAAAAILAAGIGSFALGLFSLLGDAFSAVAGFFNWYRPSGPLSGVTTSAILVWLIAWVALAHRWDNRSVVLGKVNLAAFGLLALGVLLTFPPFMDLLQGK